MNIERFFSFYIFIHRFIIYPHTYSYSRVENNLEFQIMHQNSTQLHFFILITNCRFAQHDCDPPLQKFTSYEWASCQWMKAFSDILIFAHWAEVSNDIPPPCRSAEGLNRHSVGDDHSLNTTNPGKFSLVVSAHDDTIDPMYRTSLPWYAATVPPR